MLASKQLSARISPPSYPPPPRVRTPSSLLRAYSRPRLLFLIPFALLLLVIAVIFTSNASSSITRNFVTPSFLSSSSFLTQRHISPSTSARVSLTSWISYLRKMSPTSDIRSTRVGCRELEAGAQSCVFEGLTCFATGANIQKERRPLVYLVDDSKPDGSVVPSDKWCSLRHYSADPRYFSSREWPILSNTVAPRQSCLNATYRTVSSLMTSFPHSPRIKWLPQGISLIDLDYHNNNHNNHLLKDLIWLLDASLFQDSLDIQNRPGYSAPPTGDSNAHLFRPTKHIYLPQSRDDFDKQTSRDVNRLTYSLIMRRDPRRLYPFLQPVDLLTSPSPGVKRWTAPLTTAFPDLIKNETLLFHRDIVNSNQTDLICTPRLTVGSKIGNGAHERVCRYIRQKSYEVFGVKIPELKKLGQIRYPQPPKRIVVLQRHITRRILNIDTLMNTFRNAFTTAHGVEVELVSTNELKTAEDHVRIFSRAGVLFSAHGSQNMGQMWMPRHSSIIEVMPVGYTDYAFNLLSDSCRTWYYEMQSLPHPNKTEEYYMTNCGNKKPHMMAPCVATKSVDVMVNVTDAVRLVRFALERMGFPMDPWMQFVRHG